MLRRELPPADVRRGWLIRMNTQGVAPGSDGQSVLERDVAWPPQALRLGFWHDEPVALSIETGDETWPAARDWLAQISPAESELLATALQVSHWERDHRFCGRCGHPTQRLAHEFAMSCEQCGLRAYPRISPCIITLVTFGRDMLLARSPRFPPRRYSTLAGFIEPGEAVEAAVRREVMEEVGVEVGRVSFFKSQSWPFPHSLMMGFFAEATSRRIRIDGHEIADAAWFTPERPPELPPSYSISRQLIETHRRAVATR
ncbi:NAD(+) diphosphatase [Salinicola sp. DM10]|nr:MULTISPECIES: NAD(+) diphosphatase [unclassified Salinicola]MCE3025790.1 NAD(+) diphosphatase [Salinicola sp. DM10]WIX34719.1 NAD(+) diphosphatase [Salinicola sp. JS01]